MPRVPHYQTTPFTIDPSARSTQTFAERYGVSPPQSNENLYGNDYTIIGSHDDKSAVRKDRQTGNHKVELSNAPSSSNIVQTGKNTNSSVDGERPSKASKSTVIKGSKNIPNNTHSISSDVEQRLQVSSASRHFFSYFFKSKSSLNYVVSHPPHHLCQKQFFKPFMRDETCFRVQNVKICVDWNVTGGSSRRELFCIQSFIFRLTKLVLCADFHSSAWTAEAPCRCLLKRAKIISEFLQFCIQITTAKLQLQSRQIVSFLLNLTSDDIETLFYAENVFSPSACDVSSDERIKTVMRGRFDTRFQCQCCRQLFPRVCYAFYL